MKTVFCFIFAIAYGIIGLLAEQHADTGVAFIISQIWLVGGIISIGGAK